MKIVHMLAPASAGGLERVVHALAIGQKRRGHEVLALPVVEEWTPEHSFATPLARAGVHVRPIVVPHRAYLRERAALRQVIAEWAPDVVHTHGYHADVVGGPVARRAGCGTVATAHGFTRGPLRNRFYEWLCCQVFRTFDAVAAVSPPLAEDLRRAGVPADRIHVVPNAWSWISEPAQRNEARAALGLDADGFVAGWVGRMTREKGLDVAIDALASLRHLPIRLCAVGDGPERRPQEARAMKLGVDDRIRWAGMVNEAGRYFRAFDVLVISSRTEGLPMALLEAYASQVPVVATKVGGIPGVASDAEALLVGSERPKELAAAVEAVYSEPERARQRARSAEARLERELSEEPWLMRYEELYRLALERANGRRSTT